MIYFTTFILTLLFAHSARAVSGRGDDAYPQEVYDPTYDNGQEAFPAVVHPVKVTWNGIYDKPGSHTSDVACSSFAQRYPLFGNFPSFPFTGGAFDVKRDASNCGTCWRLVNKKTGYYIHVTAINSAPADTFDISKEAFTKLNGGSAVPGTFEAEAFPVYSQPCPYICPY